ncbi:hypothetical protein LINGRAHAP2_LOCUS32003 [Linum grandiflorum]
METKQDVPYHAGMRVILNFANGYYVNPIGRAGGLALWWVQDMPIRVIRVSSHFIHVEVNSDHRFHCTFIHAPSNLNVGEKVAFWMEISNLHHDCNDPWLLVGDFNLICFPYEKEGGNGFSASNSATFWNFIASNALLDLGFQGEPFTWNNCQDRDRFIRIRLDRALSNVAWRNAYDRALVYHESDIGSDHRPIYINCLGLSRKSKCPFRFDVRWLSNTECNEIILNAWNSGHSSSDQMTSCQSSLSSWARNKYRAKGVGEEEVKARLQAIQSVRRTPDIMAEERALKGKMEDISKNEELGWSQRAKLDWLQAGDRKTAFFHASIIYRRQRNKITRLKDEHGTWISSDAQLNDMAKSYFMNLFSDRSAQGPPEGIADMPKIVTEEMNSALCKEVTNEEIRIAVFSLGANQSSGPDG